MVMRFYNRLFIIKLGGISKWRLMEVNMNNALIEGNYKWDKIKQLDEVGDLLDLDNLDKNRKDILEQYYSILNNMKNVYIFGAKSLGIKVLKLLRYINIEPIGFIDNNTKLQGNYVEGKIVLSLKDIDKDEDSIIIVASIFYMNEIISQLKENEYKNVIPYPILSLWNENNFPEHFTMENLYMDLIENKNKYEELIYLLEDEESKFILKNIIKFRKTLNFKYMDLCYDGKNTQYFDKNIITLNENDVFVDGGAFNGDSTLNYIYQSNNKYKKIYLFEPDKELIEASKRNLSCYKNISYNCMGLYKKNAFCNFNITGGLDGAINSEGDTKIKVVSLDSYIKEPITFLKLDIEGMEVEAINGARKHIELYKPILAISVYHYSSHIWKIPELIKSINSGYKFYLRHYTRNSADTVLYCI